MTEETGTLSKEESRVIDLLRKVDFGKLVVTVKKGKPVFAEIQKTVQIQENTKE